MNDDSKEAISEDETMTKQAKSNRISSPFETQQTEKEIELHKGNATLTQNGVEWMGELSIVQSLYPARVSWNFNRENGERGITFGKVEIETELRDEKFDASVTRTGGNRLSGYFKNGIELGSEHKLDSVTFHLSLIHISEPTRPY